MDWNGFKQKMMERYPGEVTDDKLEQLSETFKKYLVGTYPATPEATLQSAYNKLKKEGWLVEPASATEDQTFKTTGMGKSYEVGNYYQKAEYDDDGKPTGRRFSVQYMGRDKNGNDVWRGGSLVPAEPTEEEKQATAKKAAETAALAERKALAEAEAARQKAENDRWSDLQMLEVKKQESRDKEQTLWRKQQDLAFAEKFGAMNQSGKQFVGQDRGPAPSGAPVDWISYWKYGQQAKPVPAFPGGVTGQPGGLGVASSWEEAVRQGLTSYVTPTEITRRYNINEQGSGVPAYGTTEKQQVYDPGTQSMRPETDAEVFWRTVTMPLRDVQRDYWRGKPTGYTGAAAQHVASWMQDNPAPAPNGPGYASWKAQADAEAAFAEEANAPVGQPSVGPEAPPWAFQFMQPSWVSQPTSPTGGQYQIPIEGWRIGAPNLSRRSLSPVGTQTWAGMAPSEREGLRGLVGATAPQGMNPEDVWQDYLAESKRIAPNQYGRSTYRRRADVY